MQPEAGGGTLLHDMSRQHLSFLWSLTENRPGCRYRLYQCSVFELPLFFFLFFCTLILFHITAAKISCNSTFFWIALSLSHFLAAVQAPRKLKLLTSLTLSTRAPPATRTNKCSKSLKRLEVALPRPFPSPTQCLWCSRVRPRIDHT